MKAFFFGMVIVCCLGFSSAGVAEETSNNILDKRFTFYGGVQLYKVDGDFNSTKDGSPEIKVDLDDLGLEDDAISPAVGAMINFWGRRLTLRLDYFGYHDDAKATADFTFDFDGNTYPLGARLDSNLDLDLYVANLSYNFIRSERASLGVGLGVHLADIDLGISGTANVGGIVIPLAKGDADLLAPLPNLYVTGAYAFTDNFLIKAAGGG